jgi:hypothetical protein
MTTRISWPNNLSAAPFASVDRDRRLRDELQGIDDIRQRDPADRRGQGRDFRQSVGELRQNVRFVGLEGSLLNRPLD